MLTLFDPLLNAVLNLVNVALQHRNSVQKLAVLPLLQSHRHDVFLGFLIHLLDEVVTEERSFPLFRVQGSEVLTILGVLISVHTIV